eukprot:6214461-Pleurochrysis_carterae.AAC.1
MPPAPEECSQHRMRRAVNRRTLSRTAAVPANLRSWAKPTSPPATAAPIKQHLLEQIDPRAANIRLTARSPTTLKQCEARVQLTLHADTHAGVRSAEKEGLRWVFSQSMVWYGNISSCENVWSKYDRVMAVCSRLSFKNSIHWQHDLFQPKSDAAAGY